MNAYISASSTLRQKIFSATTFFVKEPLISSNFNDYSASILFLSGIITRTARISSIELPGVSKLFPVTVRMYINDKIEVFSVRGIFYVTLH